MPAPCHRPDKNMVSMVGQAISIANAPGLVRRLPAMGRRCAMRLRVSEITTGE